jgi:protein SCO1/2
MKGAFFIPAVLLLASCKQKIDLPEYGAVPAFALTAQTGQPFDAGKQLGGRVWVADFIYTTCPGPCPRMTSQMRRVQQAVEKTVNLVSFTVDPTRDTPEALTAYAKLHHASPENWYFLTGPVQTLQLLDKNVFKLGDVNSSLEHSTRFVLIDQHMQIRGYYDSSEPDMTSRLIADIHVLERT